MALNDLMVPGSAENRPSGCFCNLLSIFIEV